MSADIMCCICGAIDWSGSPEAEALVRRMTPTMLRRGPDDEGYLTNGGLAIGMRRLSIIDLEGGHQPILNAQRRGIGLRSLSLAPRACYFPYHEHAY